MIIVVYVCTLGVLMTACDIHIKVVVVYNTYTISRDETAVYCDYLGISRPPSLSNGFLNRSFSPSLSFLTDQTAKDCRGLSAWESDN